MKRRTRPALPAGLERARQRFERWRRTRKGHPRIPDALWAVAAKAARRFGLHPTSRALRLDYMVLKRRVGADTAGSGRSAKATAPSFVELLPVGKGPRPECVVELEDPSGARMRIELNGIAPSDLATLTRSLRTGGS